MVLGILQDSDSDMHGYSILRQLNSWRAETWTNIKPGSVYHALGQFEKHGLAENSGTKQSGGPEATSYKITEKGRHELRQLLQKALISYDQEEFAAGLAWMHVLPRNEVLSLARQRRDAHREACAFLDTLPRDDSPEIPSRHPEIIGSWHALFAAAAEWQTGFVQRLEKGAYTFNDDE